MNCQVGGRVVYCWGVVEDIVYIVAAYLIGSVPFGYLAGRLNGVDLREHGSHNIGATNAVRVLGKRWGIPVFVCDFLKGFLPLWWYKAHLGGDVTAMSEAQMGWLLGVMISLVLGHTYTCFLHFRGGKGVATMAGCLTAFLPVVAGVAVAVFVVTAAIWRYISLASLLAGVAMVAAAVPVMMRDGQATPAEWMAMGALVLILALVTYKHRANIGRICRGVEPKIFSKKK